jgi:hypothetical protein
VSGVGEGSKLYSVVIAVLVVILTVTLPAVGLTIWDLSDYGAQLKSIDRQLDDLRKAKPEPIIIASTNDQKLIDEIRALAKAQQTTSDQMRELFCALGRSGRLPPAPCN